MISRHEWVIEVLTDLCSYARSHDLPRLAESAELTLSVAREELSQQPGDDGEAPGKPGIAD